MDHADLEAKMGAIPHHDEIKKIFQPDSIQKVYERLESSKSEFGQATEKQLLPMSPLSKAIVFEQIVRGSKLNVKEVFEMEYKLAAGFLEHTEFYEGVRALLVDKDNSPNWKYSHVKQVKPADISFFFDREEQLDLNLYK
jgi:enoyl-CoA hydratase/carnithine racemase